MKNKKFSLVFFAIFGAIMLIGCAGIIPTSHSVDFSNEGVFGQQVLIPAKDFEPVGLVFTTNTFQLASNTIEGDLFTYQELLRAAQALNAHAIINIVIDKKIEKVTVGRDTLVQETWYASALAIRYTTVLRGNDNGDVHLNSPGGARGVGGGASTSNEDEAGGGGGFLGGLFGGLF